MLQQTQVARVLDFYDRFLRRFPSLGHVATAPPRRVREAWRGLGYYARAHNLHRLAREVSGTRWQGRLPEDPDVLRELPGIGAYTAGAIASFAFERRAALVDTNVARVLRRAFAPRLDPRSARGARRLWALAETLLPRTGQATWTHNQALMELGALVCTARVAHCSRCPVRALCASAPPSAVVGSRTSRARGAADGHPQRNAGSRPSAALPAPIHRPASRRA